MAILRLTVGLLMLLCLSEAVSASSVHADVLIDLKTKMTSVLQRLNDVEQQNALQAKEIDRQAHEIIELKLIIADQNEMTQRGVTSDEFPIEDYIPEPDSRSQFTAFACTFDTVSLTCPTGRTIWVTNGTYGQYTGSCSECCAPNPADDCTELVEENSPQDWLVIKAVCDNQSSCEFQNPGAFIQKCGEEITAADFLQLFYDCQPDDETGPVAFTASANTGTETHYEPFEIILFDEVLSNFGGHYNPATSSFICPVDGVYLMSLNTQSYVGQYMLFDLMRNSDVLAGIWLDDVSDMYNRGSTTIVTECSRADVLWVRAGLSSGAIYGLYRRTVFTGLLIQPL